MENFFTQIQSTILKLKTNKILIIGKGPTLDKYISLDFKDYYIINLNDSFKFKQGNLILINKPWSFNDINKVKNKSLILSSIKNIKISSKNYIYSKEFKILNFINSSFKFHNFKFKNNNKPLFLDALEICLNLSKKINQKLDLYFIGFDFNFKSLENYTSKFLEDIDINNYQIKKNILKQQKKIFLKILNSKKINNFLNIYHIGNLNKSYLTADNFLNSKNMKFQSNNRGIKIVAEITTNHFGDIKLLTKMVKLAKNAGADFVKIQKRDVETFYSRKKLSEYYYSKFGKKFVDYRKGLELKFNDIIQLDNLCKKIGIGWFATVLDKNSFDFINKFKPNLIKIPSTISTYKTFHDYISKKYSGEIVISTGFTDKKYENYIKNKFKNNKKIYLLQCTSSYPTRNEDCNVGVIKHYSEMSKKNKKIIPGYSSHDLGSTASIMAVACGAKMIEKHVYYEKKPWGHFDKVALSLKNNEFKNFVKDIRNAELIYGSEIKKILKSEHHKYSSKK